MSEVMRYIEAFKVIEDEMFSKNGLHYSGMCDFLLREGRAFDVKPKPDDIDWGKIKECYSNCYHVVELDSYFGGEQYAYCEGIAYSDGLFPMQHAWILDTVDDKIFDITWRPEKLDGSTRVSEYFGVVFPFDVMNDITDAKGTYGVLDCIDLLRQPWKVQA